MSMTSLSSLSDEEPVSGRNIPDRIDVWNKYDDEEFQSRYRFSKGTVDIILSKIGHLLEPTTKRSKAFDARTQLLIALRFYAIGIIEQVTGDLSNCHKATICRIIQKVTHAIASLSHDYIKFPTQDECHRVAEEFHELAGFPKVIGAIDCTHIKIDSPGGHLAECFRCHKGFFSINVQIVSDSKLKIRNIIARWPGSVHDSTIFSKSPLCAEMENGHYGNYSLLGDRAYFCKHFMQTPILNPQTDAEQNYNRCHYITIQSTVERCIGVWKRRFPCMYSGIRLRKMDTILKVIVATAVLHNIAIEMGEEEPISNLDVSFDISDVATHGQHDSLVRTSLVNTVFN